MVQYIAVSGGACDVLSVFRQFACEISFVKITENNCCIFSSGDKCFLLTVGSTGDWQSVCAVIHKKQLQNFI